MTYATWDTETTIKTSFKRKANPFDPANWVVTHGWKKKGDAGVSEYRFGHSPPPPGWLIPLLADIKLLVGFNIKFDLHHAMQDVANRRAWMKFVADGGQVWDCQLAEYLLNGMDQRSHMLSLDEVAPRYGGNTKVDEVKLLWSAGISTEDIEPDLLTRYLCGGEDEFGVYQKGDIENTEAIFLGQLEKARAANQVNSIMLNMGALLFTVEAEFNGLFVNKPLGLEAAKDLAKHIAELDATLKAYLPKDLPFEFNWNSRFHKSALIFGGTVQWDAYMYDTADGGGVYRHVYEDWESHRPCSPKPKLLYAQKDAIAYVLTDGSVTFHDPFEPGAPTNYATYAGGKQAGEFKTKKVKVDNFDKPKGRATRAPYTFSRITEPKKAWASADPGFWSVSSDVVEELGNRDIPFLKGMAKLAKLVKDMGTYYIVTDADGNSKGLLTMVNEYLICHHKLNMTSTVTGRLSASDPNTQNIPQGRNSDVKLLFSSRFGYWVTDDFGSQTWVPTGKIIQSDFTSLEIYIQAILTQCKQLILDLIAGLDMHCLRLASTEGMKYEDVILLCKGDRKAGVSADPVWEYKRTDSKVYSFQAAYGAGDAKIAATTGMDPERVAALRAADELRYPEIKTYFENRTKEIAQNRRPMGTAIPHPEIRGVMCNLGKSFVRTPDNKLYSYIESPSPEYLVKRGVTASFSPTEIKNYEVQGEGAEWAKAAMYLSVRAFYARENFGGKALLVNQVHDAEYADAHQDVAHEAACLLHACMEAASDYMEYRFKWTIPVPVPSDTTWGPNMKDADGVPNLKPLADTFRQELRNLYMGGYTPSYLQ